MQENRIKPNDLVVLRSFGAGHGAHALVGSAAIHEFVQGALIELTPYAAWR
jgi:hypothetical protein